MSRAAVVGAGAIGCSVAFHLARAGLEVVVHERQAEPGLGSTRHAPAGFRLFSTEVNVRLSLESLAALDRVEDAAQAAVLRERSAWQRSLGVRVEEPDAGRVAELWPDARVDDLAGAAFCPDDGTGGPRELARAYAAGAERHGAVFLFGSEVASLDEPGADTVVLAAAAQAEEPRPFLVDLDTNLVCVPRNGALLVLGREAAGIDAFAAARFDAAPPRESLVL